MGVIFPAKMAVALLLAVVIGNGLALFAFEAGGVWTRFSGLFVALPLFVMIAPFVFRAIGTRLGLWSPVPGRTSRQEGM